MENIDRIQNSSRKIIRALKIWRGFIPLATCAIWLSMNQLPLIMQKEILPDFVRLPLPTASLWAGLVITMIPVGLTIYGITILIRLFRLYQDGKIFHSENVACLHRLSKILIVLCFAGIITTTLLGVALTLHHPQGERMLTFAIKGQDITLLIVGYILSTIARVMQEACKLQEEQSLTV